MHRAPIIRTRITPKRSYFHGQDKPLQVEINKYSISPLEIRVKKHDFIGSNKGPIINISKVESIHLMGKEIVFHTPRESQEWTFKTDESADKIYEQLKKDHCWNYNEDE